MKKKELLIGKTLEDANEILRNCKWRIVSEDNIDYTITQDLEPQRYNLYLEKGIIKEIRFY